MSRPLHSYALQKYLNRCTNTVGATHTHKTTDNLKRNPNNGKLPKGLRFFYAQATIIHCILKNAHTHILRHSMQHKAHFFNAHTEYCAIVKMML